MKSIMICGTGSHVGKSVIVAALCRILSDEGYSVTPFKSQNMSLNSYVAYDGEMGYAQAMQAWCAREEPTANMNPILLKPTRNGVSQVIVRGKAYADMSVREYHRYAITSGIKEVKYAFDLLKKDHEVCVIEGAGSPAEINLHEYDIANLKVAEFANAPVILVADIDKGGVFASIFGTIKLSEKPELIKGTIINKFRGDPSLLDPGIEEIERITGVKNIGVIPYADLSIPVEDSVSIPQMVKYGGEIDIAVIRLPYVSNFSDIEPFLLEEDVSLRWVRKPEELGFPDVLIIPGSKNTVHDLKFIHDTGLRDAILEISKEIPIIGLCAGYQMLGEKVIDDGTESGEKQEIEGLGLLKVKTIFKGYKKTVRRVEAEVCIYPPILLGGRVSGYEIHFARTEGKERPSFITERVVGHVNRAGNVIGTYLHGVFEREAFRRSLLDYVCAKKGIHPPKRKDVQKLKDSGFDELAKLVRKNIDMEWVLEKI
ncbi:MAG: cobyric acid synthase [Candidatus Syntropharchaeia archaeon]